MIPTQSTNTAFHYYYLVRPRRALVGQPTRLRWTTTVNGNIHHAVPQSLLSLQKRNTMDDNDDAQELFLRKELKRLESLEEILEELEEYDLMQQGDDEEEEDVLWDEESLEEFLSSLQQQNEQEELEENIGTYQDVREGAARDLERALLQGVVPVSAGVGSDCLPGDFGFDPLNLATKDYFRQTQSYLLNILPDRDGGDSKPQHEITPRPKALILRDYREAEIRHGRLAMLAAVFWPLQEMLDRLLLNEDQFGPLIYGPITLPYFPLLMTAIMLLLGYLDIYATERKSVDQIGEAFLPGDCFWDPLKILDGTPDRTKRNMQERELFNGRAAMIAVAAFTCEEAITHLPLVSIPGNELLLEPAYQVPFIQQFLDSQFSVVDPPTDAETIQSFTDSLLLEKVSSLLDGTLPLN